MGSPSVDQLRLLYIVDRFTHSGNNGKRRWLKDLPLSVLVYHAIQRKVFGDYDWAPSLVEFHGVKMYGKVSQEAYADLQKLQRATLVEKLHLSTCLYDSIRAYRTTSGAAEALEALPQECRTALDELLSCGQCDALREILAFVERAHGHWSEVRNATVSYCPRCCTVEKRPEGPVISSPNANGRTSIDFFEIVDVVYRTKPAEARGFV
jgi:hypothetical protein